MAKLKQRSDFIDKVQSEIAKLKDIKVLSCAESVEIAFNGPRGVMKEIADEMNERNFGQPGTRFRLGEYIRRVHDGVLIIPIKNDEPVIVFKKFGAGLSQLRVLIQVPFFEEALPFVASYQIYWKGKLCKDWPPVVKRQYSKAFVPILMYAGMKPANVIELPLKIALEGASLKILGSCFITPIRNALRKIEALNEARGKGKRKIDAILQIRNRFLIAQLKRFRNSNRLPIKKLQKLWEDKIHALFPDDEDKAEKYYCNDMTIRRILQKQKAEEKALKQLKAWQSWSTAELRRLLKNIT